MLTESEKALAAEKRQLQKRIAEIKLLETRHPALSDTRIAELREDRTGETIAHGRGEVEQFNRFEAMSVLDELAAWRVYKLTDSEKLALQALAAVADATKDKVAIDAIRRIAPAKK